MIQPLLAQAAAVHSPGILESIFRDSSNVALILIFGGSFLTAIIAIVAGVSQKVLVGRSHIAIVAGVSQKVLVGRSQERTRQEVAAYVAEGTMTADEGERLLRAGK